MLPRTGFGVGFDRGDLLAWVVAAFGVGLMSGWRLNAMTDPNRHHRP